MYYASISAHRKDVNARVHHFTGFVFARDNTDAMIVEYADKSLVFITNNIYCLKTRQFTSMFTSTCILLCGT